MTALPWNELGRALFEEADDALFLLDPATDQVLDANPMAQRLCGLGHRELVERTAGFLLRSEVPGHRQRLGEACRQTGRFHAQEGFLLRTTQGGIWMPVQITVARLHVSPQPLAVIAARDQREQLAARAQHQQLEAQLRQAHKMEALGQLAGGIAHDFNNLLTAILGNLALAGADLPADQPQRELLQNAETAALRASELVQQLLSFSRQSPPDLRPVDLNTSIQEVVRLLRATIDPRVRIEIAAAPNLGTVQADAAQLAQVLLNLCLNARDAMPQGGELRLETAHVVFTEAEVREQRRTGEFVRLQVRDTGLGMSAEVQGRLFEPFFTTKPLGWGTGLGLAVVYRIVQQHQGWIECASVVQQGTCFTVYLPRHPGGVSARTALPGTPARTDGGETILLVDDEAIIRQLGQTVLERHGYRVLVAEDGEQAVVLYREAAGSIDLVLLDLTMPRLSGWDTLRQLQALDPEVRVLLASGYGAERSCQGVEGVLDFLGKPYRPDELAQAVRRALDRVRPDPGG